MKQPVTINFTTGTIVKIIALIVGAWLIYNFSNLLLLVLTAIVIASAVEPAVAWFEKFSIPRVFSTFIVYILLLTVLIGVLAMVIPSLIREVINFLNLLPTYIQTVELFLGERLLAAGFGTDLSETVTQFRQEISSAASVFVSGASGTISLIFGSFLNFLLVIVLSFYFTAQKYSIDNFLKIVVPPEYGPYSINLLRRSQRKIALWMQGQLVLALIIFVLTYLGLLVLGVEYAFLLAVIAAFGELIPLVGPVISAVPAIAVAASTGGAGLALWTLGLFVIIQQLESNLIYPLVVKKVVGVPALVVILGLIIGGSLFGFLGVILSVPVAAAVMEFVKDLEKRNDGEPDAIPRVMSNPQAATIQKETESVEEDPKEQELETKEKSK